MMDRTSLDVIRAEAKKKVCCPATLVTLRIVATLMEAKRTGFRVTRH